MDLEHELDLCPLHWDHELLGDMERGVGSNIEDEEGFVGRNLHEVVQVGEGWDGWSSGD